ncbi:MAG: hypothetical protein OXT07_12295, partial [bacterium]|nr:hypothetical protein [bacterium]
RAQTGIHVDSSLHSLRKVHRRNDGSYELRPPPKPHAHLRPWQSKPDTRSKDSDPFPETGVSTTRPANLQPVLLN